MRIPLIQAVAVAVGLVGLASLAHARGEGCGDGSCGKPVCVPSTTTVTVPRVSWGQVCEEFCTPPCCWFGCLFGKDSCCGKVMKRKELLIKVRQERRVRPTCVPAPPPCPADCPPACPPTCPTTPPGPAAPPPTPPPPARPATLPPIPLGDALPVPPVK